MGAGEGGQATALVVDAEVTSYLMMGALSPGLKRHSVTLFEGAHPLSFMCWFMQSLIGNNLHCIIHTLTPTFKCQLCAAVVCSHTACCHDLLFVLLSISHPRVRCDQLACANQTP